MEGEFRHLEDFLASAIQEKRADAGSTRIKAVIHLSMATRAEISLALADIQKRIDEGQSEMDRDAERRPFHERVIAHLEMLKRSQLERLRLLDELIARAEMADE